MILLNFLYEMFYLDTKVDIKYNSDVCGVRINKRKKYIKIGKKEVSIFCVQTCLSFIFTQFLLCLLRSSLLPKHKECYDYELPYRSINHHLVVVY
jgi:hypothetical protein